MRKIVASLAVAACAFLFQSGTADAQTRGGAVIVKGACVYQTLLMCKSIRDDKGNIYDLSGLRNQPNAGSRIDFVGVARGPVGRCGVPVAGGWRLSKGPAIFCPPLQLF
jgi:hypothetical protein